VEDSVAVALLLVQVVVDQVEVLEVLLELQAVQVHQDKEMQGVQGLQAHLTIQVVEVAALVQSDKMLNQLVVALVALVQHHL
jgi:phosphoribosylanthranilate isomerase